MPEDQLLFADYLRLAWRWRWLIVTIPLIASVVAGSLVASRPATWAGEEVWALSPPGFAERAKLLIDWQAWPEGAVGVRETASIPVAKGEYLRLALAAPSAPGVEALRERLFRWLDGERRVVIIQPPPRPPKRAKAPSLPRPTPEQVAAWTREIREIERRLPGLSATAAPYWTSRALGLQGQVEAALKPSEPEMPEPPEPPPEPPRIEAETITFVKALPIARRREPWAMVLWSAAVAGLVSGFLLACLLEYAQRTGLLGASTGALE